MKNYGVVLYDHTQDIISIIEHNLPRNKADEAATRYRETYKLPALTFEHRGLHDEMEAEACVDCKDLLAVKMRQAAG
jgi:hypothetical protein